MAQSDFWNKLKKRLREVSTAAADFTEEQALIGKLKFDILTLRRKIDHKHREIGVKVCDLSQEKAKSDLLQDGDIVRLIAEISEIERQVERKRQDITKVANQVRSRRDESKQQAAGMESAEESKSKPEKVKSPPVKPKPKKRSPKKTTVSKEKRTATKGKTATGKSRKSTEKKKKSEKSD